MNVQEFLSTVVTARQGYFELAVRNGSWKQHWYTWPDDLQQIANHATTATGDVYFSSYLFSTRDSSKENVLPSRTIQQDLDDADTSTLPLAPTVLVQTSPNRHQGFWVLADEPELWEHELLSKRLAYSIPLCDRSGWPLGHKVRVPDTFNYKYPDGPHAVKVTATTAKRYSLEELEFLPEIDQTLAVRHDEQFISYPPIQNSLGPYELLETVKDAISSKVYIEYASDSPSKDRSRSLYALEVQCFKAGLNRDQVFWIALNSINNKFKDLKYNSDRELAKDVIRAESAVKNLALNIRELILDIKKQTKTLLSERRRAIFELILAAMKGEGDFVRSVDNRRYYILDGRPMEVDSYSEPLQALLDVKYGLNKTEVEHTWCMSSLYTHTSTLPETAIIKSLSYHEPGSLLLHTGRKTVYQVTPDSIEQVNNGTNNVLFPWDNVVEPFTPTLTSDLDWGDILFGDIPNVINMSPAQATVVLKVWLVFMLLRNAANSRPILALFGQPGSSKTTIVRKVYAFLYGKNLDISGVTNPHDYDMATATLPFFVLDNLDTWEKWIPDRLAQSVGNTDVIVRKHYTNYSIIRLKRQAMIGLTAHDPKFGRADVADRMLIFNLQRFSNLGIAFKDEAAIIQSILKNRNKLWGALLKDIQLVLAQPVPDTTDLQLRIQDFAKLGEWISIGLSCQQEFRDAINHLRSSQYSFNLDEEHILVTAIQKWLVKSKCDPGPKTQDQLYQEILMCVPTEELQFFTHLYKSSNTLIKRLSTLQDTLNQIMTVDFTTGKQGQRLWILKCKTDLTDGTKDSED